MEEVGTLEALHETQQKNSSKPSKNSKNFDCSGTRTLIVNVFDQQTRPIPPKTPPTPRSKFFGTLVRESEEN